MPYSACETESWSSLQTLALLQDGLLSGFLKEPGVLCGNGGLVCNHRQKRDLGLAGILPAGIEDVQRADGLTPGDQRNRDNRIPSGLAQEGGDGVVQGIVKEHIARLEVNEGLRP